MSNSDQDQKDINRPHKKKLKNQSQNTKRIAVRWAFSMMGWTIVISIALSFVSNNILKDVGYIIAFALLGAFILFGIIFDILGIATASASEKPFHSMASRRISGSEESIWLIRNAEKVSSFCNDVVGDISGIISGTTAAIIVERLNKDFTFNGIILPLLITGLVAGVTVFGKAIGKSYALNHNNEIVFLAGRLLHIFKRKRKSNS